MTDSRPAIQHTALDLPSDLLGALFEYSFGDVCRPHCVRPTGVEGQMRNDFGSLNLGQTVIHGFVHMERDLSGLPHCNQSRDRDQAAVTGSQCRAQPQVMEQYRSCIACERVECRADHLFYRRHAHLFKGFINWEQVAVYIRQCGWCDTASLING